MAGQPAEDDDLFFNIDANQVNPVYQVSLPFYIDALGFPVLVTGRLFDFRYAGYGLLMVPYIIGHFTPEYIMNQFEELRGSIGMPLHIHNDIYHYMQASLQDAHNPAPDAHNPAPAG